MKNFFKNHRPKTGWAIFLFLSLFIFFPVNRSTAEGRQRIEAILHIHSTYSFKGELTPEEIVGIAHEKGLGAVVFADDAIVKISYGVFPFRNLLKISVEETSVFKRGLHHYLRELEKVHRKYPSILVMPGLEVAPFYYWGKFPLLGKGIVRDWNKHMLVMGLDERGFRSLPLAGCGPLPCKPFKVKDLFRFWGVLSILLGISCFKKRAVSYRDEMGRILSPPSPLFRSIGWSLVLAGTLGLVENYPYCEPAVTIYSSVGKILPYQRVIDHVQKKGGLVFWAHPEARDIPRTVGPVTFLTNPYPEALEETKEYTGFAVFHEGFKTIGPPGGVWDQLLLEYCEGKRKRPVWTIGELDYTKEGQAGTWIDTVKTIVFARAKREDAFWEALREGRMVAVLRTREGEITFRDFWVEDTGTGRRAQMGETLFLKAPPKINFVFSLKGKVSKVQIRLIRNGKVIQEWGDSLPLGKVYEDAALEGSLSYYRLEAKLGDGGLLVTNPIFVSRIK